MLRREQLARLQAEEASRLKDEFLATVSHELRTPLNAIMGWSQMLVSNKLDPADTACALETIYRNSRSQAQLIEDILDVSRIVTGKIRIEAKPILLAPVMQIAVASLRPAIEAKNIRLQTQLEFEPKMVRADADRLQQVIWNLLLNAIKFTPEKGEARVGVESSEKHTEIVVSDTGKGIGAEFSPYIFERFRQADGSSTRKHGGLGLGLSIVRLLVDLHGGTIEVESGGENLGAQFTVCLSVWDVSCKIADVKLADSATNGRHRHIQTFASETAIRIKGLRVLIVDDETDTLEILAAALAQNEVEVKTETRVTEVLEIIKAWKPDIVVSNLAMPGEDGYSLIKKLRNLSTEQGGDTPAIAMIAYVGIRERARVLGSGFQMYVRKPIEPSDLLEAIATFSFKS